MSSLPEIQSRDSGHQWLGCFLFFVMIPLQACSSIAVGSRTLSGIDAQYRRTKKEHPAKPQGTSSPSVSFYQAYFSQTLGSHCSLYPSDSQYAQILVTQCGAVAAIFRSMARFYLEPDAATLGMPIIQTRHQILFEDLPDACNLD